MRTLKQPAVHPLSKTNRADAPFLLSRNDIYIGSDSPPSDISPFVLQSRSPSSPATTHEIQQATKNQPCLRPSPSKQTIPHNGYSRRYGSSAHPWPSPDLDQGGHEGVHHHVSPAVVLLGPRVHVDPKKGTIVFCTSSPRCMSTQIMLKN